MGGQAGVAGARDRAVACRSTPARELLKTEAAASQTHLEVWENAVTGRCQMFSPQLDQEACRHSVHIPRVHRRLSPDLRKGAGACRVLNRDSSSPLPRFHLSCRTQRNTCTTAVSSPRRAEANASSVSSKGCTGHRTAVPKCPTTPRSWPAIQLHVSKSHTQKGTPPTLHAHSTPHIDSHHLPGSLQPAQR